MMHANAHPEIQSRDYETLEPLVFSYRITTAQIEARRYGINARTAKRRLDRLVDGKLLTRLTAWISNIPDIAAPIAEWHPGDPIPDFGAIAYAAQLRWQDRPVRETTIYTASKKLLAMFALPPRPHIKLHHATHDLGLTETYFYCRECWPEFEFVGEDIFSPERGHGEGVEDAQLVSNDLVIAAVEYAGSYRRSRVEHFHTHVSERVLPYFLF